jgi:hypothetical protein
MTLPQCSRPQEGDTTAAIVAAATPSPIAEAGSGGVWGRGGVAAAKGKVWAAAASAAAAVEAEAGGGGVGRAQEVHRSRTYVSSPMETNLWRAGGGWAGGEKVWGMTRQEGRE